MGKIVPAIAIAGIILSDYGPLALGQIGTPPLPILFALRVVFEALMFRGHRDRRARSKLARMTNDRWLSCLPEAMRDLDWLLG